jgi:endonuclease YncB( thermonuclease family)
MGNYCIKLCEFDNISTTESQKKTLSSITLDKTKPFSFENLYVYGKVVDCYDGDTCRIAFYYKDEIIQLSCRMQGYDAPEIKISVINPRREYLKDLAIKSRDKLKQLTQLSKDGLVKVKFGKNDLYGRPLVNLFVEKDNEEPCPGRRFVGKRLEKG